MALRTAFSMPRKAFDALLDTRRLSAAPGEAQRIKDEPLLRVGYALGMMVLKAAGCLAALVVHPPPFLLGQADAFVIEP